MKRLSLAAMLLAATLALFGQSDDPSIELEEALLNQQLSSENALRLTQSGNFNQAAIKQSDRQATQVLQEGSHNEANLRTQGRDNQLQLRQSGDDNYYDLDLEGDANRLYLRQNGSGNRITQRFYNVEDLLLGINQLGAGNEIQQTASGLNGQGVPLLIQQQGNGMKLYITH